jgi:hypothetical protein
MIDLLNNKVENQDKVKFLFFNPGYKINILGILNEDVRIKFFMNDLFYLSSFLNLVIEYWEIFFIG